MRVTKNFSTSEWCKNFEIMFQGEEGKMLVLAETGYSLVLASCSVCILVRLTTIWDRILTCTGFVFCLYAREIDYSLRQDTHLYWLRVLFVCSWDWLQSETGYSLVLASCSVCILVRLTTIWDRILTCTGFVFCLYTREIDYNLRQDTHLYWLRVLFVYSWDWLQSETGYSLVLASCSVCILVRLTTIWDRILTCTGFVFCLYTREIDYNLRQDTHLYWLRVLFVYSWDWLQSETGYSLVLASCSVCMLVRLTTIWDRILTCTGFVFCLCNFVYSWDWLQFQFRKEVIISF